MKGQRDRSEKLTRATTRAMAATTISPRRKCKDQSISHCCTSNTRNQVRGESSTKPTLAQVGKKTCMLGEQESHLHSSQPRVQLDCQLSPASCRPSHQQHFTLHPHPVNPIPPKCIRKFEYIVYTSRSVATHTSPARLHTERRVVFVEQERKHVCDQNVVQLAKSVSTTEPSRNRGCRNRQTSDKQANVSTMKTALYIVLGMWCTLVHYVDGYFTCGAFTCPTHSRA